MDGEHISHTGPCLSTPGYYTVRPWGLAEEEGGGAEHTHTKGRYCATAAAVVGGDRERWEWAFHILHFQHLWHVVASFCSLKSAHRWRIHINLD